MKNKTENINAYIAEFPSDAQKKLIEIRETIKLAAPKAQESISYGIPTFKLNGPLVYFAGYARHIGFYPGAGGIASFRPELASYKTSKGTVQFPLDEPLPSKLITKIVRFRVKQNLERKK